MNEHQVYTDLLPQYAAGALDDESRLAVEDHLAQCPECQEEVRLWKAAYGEIVAADHQVEAPPALVETAIQTIREQDQQRLVSRVSWVRADTLILQPADRDLGDGRFGTHYDREKVVK